MKILLTAINAKYIHSNYAVRCIKSYLESHSSHCAEIVEYTINHDISLILRELYERRPDVLGFSCYIWNIEYVRELTLELKKLLPQTVIIWGGPEVSYSSTEYAGKYPDCIICGEGEAVFPELLERLKQGEMPAPVLYGRPVCLDEIPFVYQDMTGLEHRILYYESSRGCPFGCQYCLSSVDRQVRFQSLERTLSDFDFFLAHRVPQVKLIDRTFNCDIQRTKALWRYLTENDNGVTNFHFEIAGELLDEESLEILSAARPGLFQMEIGVQSTNPRTLKAICRRTDMKRLFSVVSRLREMGNIHLHLDLIAGLPYEDIASFARSFNTVYALKPHQLQLGFLKVLKGSGMAEKKAEYGLLHTERPPYEVMRTSWLSYDDVLRLKMTEDMVERYYNSGRYHHIVRYLERFFESPFAFYDALGQFYHAKGLHLLSVSETESYTVLRDFFGTLGQEEQETLQWLVRYDLFCHQKAKKLPEWLSVNGVTPYLPQIRAFYEQADNRSLYPGHEEMTDPRQLMRVLHLEVFPFDPRTGKEKTTALLFDYRRKDIFGNAAVTEVTESLFF